MISPKLLTTRSTFPSPFMSPAARVRMRNSSAARCCNSTCTAIGNENESVSPCNAETENSNTETNARIRSDLHQLAHDLVEGLFRWARVRFVERPERPIDHIEQADEALLLRP